MEKRLVILLILVIAIVSVISVSSVHSNYITGNVVAPLSLSSISEITLFGFEENGAGTCVVMFFPVTTGMENIIGTYRLFYGFEPGATLSAADSLVLYITECKISSTGYVSLKKTSGDTIKVYPPAVETPAGDYYLYLSEDGSTYTDSALTILAKAAPHSGATPLTVTNGGMPFSQATDGYEGIVASNPSIRNTDTRYLLYKDTTILSYITSTTYTRQTNGEFTSSNLMVRILYKTSPIIASGDYLTLNFIDYQTNPNYQLVKTAKVYLPSSWSGKEYTAGSCPSTYTCVDLYLAEDGSTYYDSDLTQLAQAVSTQPVEPTYTCTNCKTACLSTEEINVTSGTCATGKVCCKTKTTTLNPQTNQNSSLTILSIPTLTLYLNSQPANLELSKYITDKNNKIITFAVEESSNFFDCELKGNLLSCTPKTKGSGSVNIQVSTESENRSTSLTVNVLEQPTQNSAPVSVAGSDKTTIPNKEVILDASASYDTESNLSDLESVGNSPTYLWYTLDKTTSEQQEVGRSKISKVSFPKEGVYRVYLRVTDPQGLSSQSSLKVFVTAKKICKGTNTTYFPPTTFCTKQWHSLEGEKININSEGYACDLFEVCSDKFDYILDDAVNCCDGTPISMDEEDTKSSAKQQACTFANKHSKGNVNRCEALYLIRGIGPSKVYMQGYFEAEMCCYGVEELCNDKKYLFKPLPAPETSTDLKGLKCRYDFNKLLGFGDRTKQGQKGEWLSDSRLEKNNIALSDVPAHVSLNILGTGTCADYSMALTTLLRKAGYEKDEVLTVEGEGHAYNLLKLPLENKYRFIDTTGNNIGIDFSKAFPTGRDKYDYCRNMKACYNDYGALTCPLMQDIVGCELVTESFTKKTQKFVGTITDFGGEIANKLIKEATRA
jgi:hypothetical protein